MLKSMRLTNAVHVTAARLRILLNVKGPIWRLAVRLAVAPR